VVAVLGTQRQVFDIEHRPRSRGEKWLWATEDLDMATVGPARVELAELFTVGPPPRHVLVYVGPDRFVDLQGLQLLLDLAGQVRRRGGDLAVAAAPHCLEKMVKIFELGEQLPIVATTRRITWPACNRTAAQR